MDETTNKTINPIRNTLVIPLQPIVAVQPQLSPSNPPNVDNSPKPKHAGGRPCEYCQDKDNILSKTREYVNSGKQDKPKILFLNELSTIVLGKHRETILEWSHRKKGKELEHPEFSDLIKELEELQELRLQQRVLGRYNPTGSIFLLKTKHGYIETEKQVHAGDPNEPLQITITEEKHVLDE